MRALDGKHVVIKAAANSGSQFYNYKGTSFVAPLALVVASYRFRVVDVGAFGGSSDGGVFAASAFRHLYPVQKTWVPCLRPLWQMRIFLSS